MRGTQYTVKNLTDTKGIIPAYAGNTRPPAWRRYPTWGSSPRMRGTPKATIFHDGATGIIPAYAGNTMIGRQSIVCAGDHPRVCGEHSTCADHEIPWRGIIPAYAGNTLFSTSACRFVWDHPRVCGEHTVLDVLFDAVSGSSPRMRGTH